MERRINKKVEAYLAELKENVKEKAEQLGMNKQPNMIQLVQFIYDYERLILNKEDFMKRKRVKNLVHHSDRCSAKRANGEQCSRRRKDDSEYCGTHLKGTPHGICQECNDDKPVGTRIEVWAQDIMGIIYYIDKSGNVYQAEDVACNKINPKIIAKYVKVGDTYSIPEFGI
jgi:hypothetical protein